MTLVTCLYSEDKNNIQCYEELAWFAYKNVVIIVYIADLRNQRKSSVSEVEPSSSQLWSLSWFLLKYET